jgi:hypothetical protein
MKSTLLKSSLSILLVMVAAITFAQKKETRDVSDFTSIDLGVSAELYLSQGSPQKVVIQAQDDQIDEIETIVRNGHLKIKTESWRTRFRNVKIWITVPEITGLHVSGSGKIFAETPVKSDELEFRVSGSGNIKVDKLQAEELEASISGSGHIHLGGSAEEMGISISGSGSMGAEKLKVGEVDARISGSGSCRVDAIDELNAAISGSGRVTYYSNPQVDASVSGSGKVRKGN